MYINACIYIYIFVLPAELSGIQGSTLRMHDVVSSNPSVQHVFFFEKYLSYDLCCFESLCLSVRYKCRLVCLQLCLSCTTTNLPTHVHCTFPW